MKRGKKLRLQKETLAVLDAGKLARVQGGESDYCSFRCTYMDCSFTFFNCTTTTQNTEIGR